MKLMIFIISLFLFLSCGNKGSNIGHNIELTITPSMQKKCIVYCSIKSSCTFCYDRLGRWNRN